jgi:phthalate 4,5-dioxygenase oxygenase subunit
MLSRQDNEILTQVGPGTAMGELMRRYWLPVVFSSELAAGDRAKRVRLLGEDLVVFRTARGDVGLFAEYCSHRRVSLYFGRLEDDGLRCCYHGWKYGLDGQCLEMPNEAPETEFKHAVRHPAYPCRELGGVVWAFMGNKAQAPALPDFEWLGLPDNQCFLSKFYQFSNYFQAMEGGIDSSHISFLHAPLNSTDPELIAKVEKAGFGVGSAVQTADRSPRFEVVNTDYGVMIGARRNFDDASYYWRITQFIMPFYTMPPPQDRDPILHSHAWVPVDDEHFVNWTITWHPTRPLNEEELAALKGGMSAHVTNYAPPTSEAYGDIRAIPDKATDYGMDWRSHQTSMFCGIPGFGVQDRAMTESQGPIYDRTRERLGTSDTAIIQVRSCLIDGAKALRRDARAPLGLDPRFHRIRSTSLRLPKDVPWVEAVDRVIVSE